jgi:hypothetical protein
VDYTQLVAIHNNMTKGKKGFQKGKSGNPSGRPKGYADFAKRCRTLADEEGFDILKKHLSSSDERISLDAARFVVERGYGKSLERIAVDINPEKLLTDAQLCLIAAGKAVPADFIK